MAPACAGLAVCHHQIADLLTGEQFRTVVAQLIPWFAGIAFLFGVSTFYLVQAFYLALRPNQLLWAYGPASLATLVLNIALVPFFGLWGAVASGGISQIVLMAGLVIVGRRVFSLPCAARGRPNRGGNRVYVGVGILDRCSRHLARTVVADHCRRQCVWSAGPGAVPG